MQTLITVSKKLEPPGMREKPNPPREKKITALLVSSTPGTPLPLEMRRTHIDLGALRLVPFGSLFLEDSLFVRGRGEETACSAQRAQRKFSW